MAPSLSSDLQVGKRQAAKQTAVLGLCKASDGVRTRATATASGVEVVWRWCGGGPPLSPPIRPIFLPVVLRHSFLTSHSVATPDPRLTSHSSSIFHTSLILPTSSPAFLAHFPPTFHLSPHFTTTSDVLRTIPLQGQLCPTIPLVSISLERAHLDTHVLALSTRLSPTFSAPPFLASTSPLLPFSPYLLTFSLPRAPSTFHGSSHASRIPRSTVHSPPSTLPPARLVYPVYALAGRSLVAPHH